MNAPAPSANSIPATTAAPTTAAAGTTTASSTTTTAIAGTTAPELPVDSAAPGASPPIEVTFSTSSEDLKPITFLDSSIGVQEQPIDSAVLYAEFSGDLEGLLTRSVMTIDHSSLSLEWFEGRVADCGNGAMALRTGTRPDGTTGWEIVPGLGVGDLAEVTGNGTVTIDLRFEGTVRCHGAADPMTFSSTILQPIPDDGAEVGVPLHVSLQRDEQEVAVHPAQVNAPRLVAVNATYDVWLARATYFWMREDVTTMTRTESVAYDFLEDVCGHSGVVRIILDDYLLPPYRGGWDIPPELNQGAYGAGRFDASTNVGRVVCPG